MKHIVMPSSKWKYSEEPFPAFRTRLVFGRNKHDFAFIPSKVAPNEEGLLPEGNFRVIKTKAKGTIMAVPGKETTTRTLLFVGDEGGFRGYVSLLEGDTTATLLAKCYAGNACEDEIQIAAILDVGEQIAFHSRGRRTNRVAVYSWDGVEVKRANYHYDEYLAAKEGEGEESERI